jgi:hypothetical protein
MIPEAMPRRSLERRDGWMSVPASARRTPFGSREVRTQGCVEKALGRFAFHNAPSGKVAGVTQGNRRYFY